MQTSEIIFEVREDEVDGGYVARALSYSIHTQADSLEELRVMVKDAVAWHFGDGADRPSIIRLHSSAMKCSRDETSARLR